MKLNKVDSASAVAAIAIFVTIPFVLANTDASDVQALQVLYTSLNSPSQLTGWKSSGGDPCGESWKGLTCEGSAVVSVVVPGLGLSGTMGYLLSDLLSLKTLDLSDNNIHDSIPFQLPPNLTSLNLASNNLSGNLPYSFSNMVALDYLNLSHNSLSQSIGDFCAKLQALSALDLSFNNFSGDLPSCFSSLSNLSTLYMQTNQLTGSVNVLADLPLTNLNIADNHFSGWIPQGLSSIPNFIYGGNSFDNGPAPPPPPYSSPPPGSSHNNHNHSGPGTNASQSSHPDSRNKSNGLGTGPLLGIILGSVAVLCLVLAIVFCIRKRKVGMQSSARASIGTPSAGADKGGASKFDIKGSDILSIKHAY